MRLSRSGQRELRCNVVIALLVVDGVSTLFEWVRFFLIADLFFSRGGDDLHDTPKPECLLAAFFCGAELADCVRKGLLCFDFNLGDDVLSLELLEPFALFTDVPLFFDFETLLRGGVEVDRRSFSGSAFTCFGSFINIKEYFAGA